MAGGDRRRRRALSRVVEDERVHEQVTERRGALAPVGVAPEVDEQGQAVRTDEMVEGLLRSGARLQRRRHRRRRRAAHAAVHHDHLRRHRGSSAGKGLVFDPRASHRVGARVSVQLHDAELVRLQRREPRLPHKEGDA